MLKDLLSRLRTTFTFNHQFCKKYDAQLSFHLSSGIKSINKNSEFEINITFNDETIFKAWNANKWYAWLANATFSAPYNNYNKVRPSATTMLLLDKAIKNFNPININNIKYKLDCLECSNYDLKKRIFNLENKPKTKNQKTKINK